jgi:DNA repair photolyase
MRWNNLLAEAPAAAPGDAAPPLPLFPDAVVRRLHAPQFRGMTFYEVHAKSIVNHVPGDRFGFNWTINPYRGCSHACVYCFARPTHAYLDLGTGRDFEKKIVVKVNAVERLRHELRRPRWGNDLIAMGTNTDPYQRAEGHYELMRGILGALNEARNPYSILTKGTLIQRDFDLLAGGAEVTDVSVNFSVGSIDSKVWRETEPGTPHPLRRIDLCHRLNEMGIPCGILMAPILPGISDSPEQLRATVEAAAAAGATHVTPIVLHLRPGVKEEFTAWLERAHPELLGDYATMYKGRSYAPRDASAPIRSTVARVRYEQGQSGSGPGPRGPRNRPRRAAPPSAGAAIGRNPVPEQLSLGL